ncbi:hypothetical protein [Rhizobium sp. BT03]|uniref:hypothetical protein n=1 Tax=Rhizobium sp. BT03 TaxID=3045156 RepID=UPI0024B3DE5B|nr:hypothetical protein [Rhizobium sp. BT03]WHO76009.1 hypothetical protein QMO80_005115 [Rhizobium sp. BT03]
MKISKKLKVDEFRFDAYIGIVDIACLTFVIARWQRALDELPSSKSRSSSVVLPARAVIQLL